MSAAAVLAISFTISPLLAEPGAAPKLQVRIENTTTNALEVMRFESDACFAHFFLSLPLTLPDGTKPEPAGCPIRSWPGVKGTLAAGAAEERELDLAKIYPSVKWIRGRYALHPEWHPEELTSYFGGHYVLGASQTSVNAEHFDLLAPVGKFRVERGHEVTLSDGARFSFVAHGHKRTMGGGPSSPLIIHGAFAAPGKKVLEPFEEHVQTEETRVFRLPGGFTFALGRYDYDGFMELSYFGPLP